MSRPVVVLMCAPIAAGKTTVAVALQGAGFTRLSVDAAAFARGWTGVLTRQQELAVDAELRSELDALLAAGRDVVLDFTFSTREVRDEYRRVVGGRGEPVVVHVRTPVGVALDRLAQRQDAHGDDVTMTREAAARHHEQFEVPTPQEGPVVVCDGTRPVDVPELLRQIRQQAA